MIEQYYPGKFSPEARAAVEGELIRAGHAHDQRKKDWRSDFSFPLELSLQTYILNVFLVYAREAIELGKKGIWTVDQVRAQALEGLRLIAIEIGSRKNYSFIEQGGCSIRRETQQEIEGTTEWREFEDELLALADSKRRSFPDPFVIDASARPLGDNPFPLDHLAYDAFEEATWKAKNAIAAIKLEFQKTNANTVAEFIRALLLFRERWFTATAFEATLIVGNNETAQWYEQWIDEAAKWFLEDTLAQVRRKPPKADAADRPFFGPEDLEYIENHLTRELMRMVTHYKGVAAARVIEVMGLRNAARAATAGNSDGEANHGQSNRNESNKVKTVLASNIDRLRRDCGWSFDLLSEKTGLDKKLILGHVNEGKPAQVRTLKTYADTFTKALSRPVSVAELESSLINATETPPT